MSLKISNLSLKQNDKWILRDVSFEVAAGEIFGLIGENEEGKSAVLRSINDSKTSAKKNITFDDQEITDEKIAVFPAIEKKVGWQKFFPAKEHAELSDGEKIKRDFEAVLNDAEKILLLDKPFCCLNENLRDEMQRILCETVKAKNLIVIITTGDSQETFAVCDRAGVLKNGEIIQTGTPRELYEKPESVAVASAFGRNNFIKAMRISFTNQHFQEFQTLTGEHRLQTDKSEKSTLGAINAPITLVIRPEHISISFGASFPEDNLLRAKIADVHYRGATTRIILDANDLILEALVLRLVGLKIGDECMVGLPPDRIHVLKN